MIGVLIGYFSAFSLLTKVVKIIYLLNCIKYFFRNFPFRVAHQEVSSGETVDGCSSAAMIKLPPSRWGAAPAIGKNN